MFCFYDQTTYISCISDSTDNSHFGWCGIGPKKPRDTAFDAPKGDVIPMACTIWAALPCARVTDDIEFTVLKFLVRTAMCTLPNKALKVGAKYK